jgi:ferredoxin
MRALSRLGPTWSSSPVRRIVQTIALAFFLILFLYVSWPYGGKNYSETLAAKEWVDAEIFLAMDPLVSVSTAIAARMWVWSLAVAGVILCIGLVIPRGFCGYVCPMGTFLDLFDWALSRRALQPQSRPQAWWMNLRFFILFVMLVSAAMGVLLSGFVAAMAVWTRAMLLIAGPVQAGLLKGWYLVPPMNAGQWISLALFGGIIATGFLERRFWCKYLCPTGAIFSLAAMLSLTGRKISDDCVNCGRCKTACDFAAMREDFTTHQARCSFCQSCGGVCPVGAIQFTDRWDSIDRKMPSVGTSVSHARRQFLAGLGAAVATGAGLAAVIGKPAAGGPEIRPPGSVPEEAFLRLCIRCGQCIKVCPNNVLHLAGFETGFNGLWAPRVVADWSGCEPSCNNCGQVCPTGAIRALTLEEKRAAQIALAVVDKKTCLPYAGRKACQYCVDECKAAGYDAIEFIRVRGQADESGRPVEGIGFLAPVVLEDKCVGCGLCQMRCRVMNVKNERQLNASAIVIQAGSGREDRIFTGSYVELHHRRQNSSGTPSHKNAPAEDYLPEFLR